MPTTRPRLTVTESDLLAAALDVAAERWPADRDNRPRLLLHLAQAGHEAIAHDAATGRARRIEAIRATSGALTGCYGEHYLHDLRADWPE